MTTRMAALAGPIVVAATGCGLWILSGTMPRGAATWSVAGFLAAAWGAYMASEAWSGRWWLRGACYVAALLVCGASVLTHVVPVVRGVGSWTGLSRHAEGLDGYGQALLAVPAVGGAIVVVLILDGSLKAVRRAPGGGKRRHARSQLFGTSTLLGGRHMKKLMKRNGILLGQLGRSANAPLVGWGLEGSAISFAPPRVGKGATIALNLLSPRDRGFNGSTVIVDPRGELFCVVARRRRQMGRRVVLVDPFGVVRKHKEEVEGLHLPDVKSATYNPIDFIRDDDELGVQDINVLLDALLTSPKTGPGTGNTGHFHASARAILAGYIAWVRYREPVSQRSLGRVRDLLTQKPAEQKAFGERVLDSPSFAGDLAHIAVSREMRAGKEEAGGNFSTIANQLGFIETPAVKAQMSGRSTFDPKWLVEGDTDVFVVAPEDQLDKVAGWLRLWITIPYAMASLHALKRDMLIVIDELPRLGRLKPVIDAYTMAAGRGVHFWCFAQSISALDATWGKEDRMLLMHLAEVVQFLGFPRTDVAGAKEMSEAMGYATWENVSESRSAQSSGDRVLAAGGSLTDGTSASAVKEALVTPDDLLRMGPDDQYVIASPKSMPRDALRLRHARYWKRRDAHWLADPNPLVLRKEGAARRGRAKEAAA